MIVADLIQPFNAAITSIALSLPRLITCFLIVPALSGRNLHGLIRMAVGVGVGLPVAAGIYYQHEVMAVSTGMMIGLFLKEAVVGLLMGFMLALPFWVFESIGILFDTQRGAMMGQQLNPESGSMTSVTGLLLQQAAVILMIQIGAFSWLFGLLIDSYAIWPAMAWLPDFTANAPELLITQFSGMIQSFVIYALPLILVLASIELVFALIGVYSPQLQVYFIAMPIKSLAGWLVLILYASLLWKHGESELLQLKDTGKLLQSLMPAFVGRP